MAEFNVQLTSSLKCHGGSIDRFSHKSITLNNTTAQFRVFFPPKAIEEHVKVPVMIFLGGLTCNDENFMIKSHALAFAARHNIAIVTPDTSPRGEEARVEGDEADWQVGQSAGWYVDATQEPYASRGYKMFTYINEELPNVLSNGHARLSDHLDMTRVSISGHSMGGHGALISFLRHAGKYRCVSTFSPISHPSESAWGVKAFTAYLGTDKESWKQYDATELMSSIPLPASISSPILIDCGTADKFLLDGGLRPEDLAKAASERGWPLELRMREGYDHSYWFIQSFIEEHIEFHAKHLWSA